MTKTRESKFEIPTFFHLANCTNEKKFVGLLMTKVVAWKATLYNRSCWACLFCFQSWRCWFLRGSGHVEAPKLSGDVGVPRCRNRYCASSCPVALVPLTILKKGGKYDLRKFLKRTIKTSDFVLKRILKKTFSV